MAEEPQVKVMWKLGSIELQYEGNESFLKDELPKLFQQLIEIYKSDLQSGENEPVKPLVVTDTPTEPVSSNSKPEWSLISIIKKLGLKGRKNLVMAACVYLTLVEGKETFSRDEIHKVMKRATGFYNPNYTRSLSQYIISLLQQEYLIEHAQGVYAIHANRLKELESKLAD